MDNKKVIILGAGITGLATAWSLLRDGYDVTIIEKTDSVGGMANTIDWGGWKFDFGAHNFHTKHNEIIQFLTKNLPNKFIPRKIKVKLHIFNKLMNYPILGAQVFASLSGFKALIAMLDFGFTRVRAFLFGIKTTEHLDKWIIRRFGRTLYKIYFQPYIQRIQKKDIHLLSSDIGRKKIPIFSIRQYLLRELTRNKIIHPDEKFLFNAYYCKGGFGEICNFFLNDPKLPGTINLLLNQTIKKISVKGNIITEIETNHDKYKTDNIMVVSTIPIVNLLRIMECPDGLRKESENLEYTSARFLLLKVKKDSILNNNWVNFNGEDFIFNRVSENTYNDEFNMVPTKGCSSLTFELPLNQDDEYWSMSDKDLLMKILPSFNKVFPLAEENIIDLKSLWLEYATPRMVVGYQNILNSIFSFTTNIGNFFCIGRQGVFSYMNIDQCIRFAFDFSDALKSNKAEHWQKQIIKTLHNVDLLQDVYSIKK